MPPDADWPPRSPSEPLAVLVSGGVDSCVLVAEAARAYPAVHPLYVRVGACWEGVELDHLGRFLDAVRSPALAPLVTFHQPVGDLYGGHWSLTGRGVPALGDPDDDCYLPGRNVLLLAQPLLWCGLNRVPAVATAPLGSNPFPDATPAFYDGLAAAVGAAVGAAVRVLRPYADLGLHKEDVVRRGAGLPLGLTFSCMTPVDGRHCGRCAKCGERHLGFRAAGVPDPTRYADDAVRRWAEP